MTTDDDSDGAASALPEQESTPIGRLRAQLLRRWRAFPEEKSRALDRELEGALKRAAEADPEVITVMNPMSRPLTRRLATLVTDGGLDKMYRQEWAELAVSEDGCCYLVYRRRDGNHYAIEWSPATALPETMMSELSEPLASALLESDSDC
jgi:hypothetical protein